jgi:hypothetical protein
MSASHNPFSLRAALALALGAAALLFALLWMIGAGVGGDALNDGGGHAGGKGLAGYAGLARLLGAAGYEVSLARDDAALNAPGLLVLTPPQQAPAGDIARIVATHRAIGPVAVILPKWLGVPASGDRPGARPGWVDIAGASAPNWPGFRDDIGVYLAGLPGGQARWVGPGDAFTVGLPAPRAVESGNVITGRARLVPLVVGDGGRILAARLVDADATGQPLYLIFEPDLLDNFGLAHPENAALAEALVVTMAGGGHHVSFDLTLNGLARRANLLTLALTPPYLAATLCLLLAVLVALWRGALRFGAPLVEGRAIAFGKAALVANAAGLIRRTGRLHLLPAAYLSATRDRLARALGLPRLPDSAATDAAIDRALAARAPAHLSDSPSFSTTGAELLAARREAAILAAAARLHALERTLTR